MHLVSYRAWRIIPIKTYIKLLNKINSQNPSVNFSQISKHRILCSEIEALFASLFSVSAVTQRICLDTKEEYRC